MLYSLDYKFNGECEKLIHVSCIDMIFFNNYKANDSSCIEICSSVDKIKLLNTTWLCTKCKYTRYDMIESTNLEDELSFEKK